MRPELRLRLLLTQGSYAHNLAIIKRAPPEVGITYYDGGRTYTLARQPMIDPAMREAMKGRWFGCYPTLCGAWYSSGPFAGAAYMKERMSELHKAGVVNLAGFAPGLARINELALTAAAEYAWNSGGRTPRDLVLAWATRRRLSDPEKVAQWWQCIEEAERDIYISQFPSAGPWSSWQRLLETRQAAGRARISCSASLNRPPSTTTSSSRSARVAGRVDAGVAFSTKAATRWPCSNRSAPHTI